MAEPFPLQSSYMGMQQDESRDLLPGGVLWNCVDFIPNYLGAPLRKRGGWSYASPAFTANAGNFVDGLVYAPFPAGEKFIAIVKDGGGSAGTYSYTSGSSAFVAGGGVPLTAIGVVMQNPIYANTTVAGAPVGTVIIPLLDRTVSPKSYDGTTFGTLGGSPPNAMLAAVWNSRVILANGNSAGIWNQNRVWFGQPGNAAGTWDLTNAWQDVAAPITGIAVLKTAILCFHQKATTRIRGTTPPSATGIGDLVIDQAFQVGCVDAKTIVNYNDTVIWADVRGVYQTDGAALKDLTGTGGMRAYWRNLLFGYNSSYHLAAGVINDTLIISVGGFSGSVLDVLAYDLTRGYWYRLTNFGARCFARVSSFYEELHMGMMYGNGFGRVAALSTIFTPQITTKNDNDGTAVAPYIETGMFRGFMRLHRRWIPSMALQNWNALYLNYDLRDAATDNPTMTIGYATDPGSSTYINLPYLMNETTKFTRVRRDLGAAGSGINSSGLMLKIAQTGPSQDTRLHTIECIYSPREGSRLAQ